MFVLADEKEEASRHICNVKQRDRWSLGQFRQADSDKKPQAVGAFEYRIVEIALSS